MLRSCCCRAARWNSGATGPQPVASCGLAQGARGERARHHVARPRPQVHGGVDLRLSSRAAPAHRRVPSDEALLRMAAQHRAPLPPPRASVPLPALPAPPAPAAPAPAPAAAAPPPRAPARAPLPTAQTAPAATPPRAGRDAPKAPPWEPGRARDGAPPRRPLRDVGNSAAGAPPGAAACAAASPAAPAFAGAGAGASAPAAAGARGAGADAGARGAGADAGADAARQMAEARAVYGERFCDRAARVQRESPHGRRPGWAVRPVIVKSGDDCRQARSLGARSAPDL